MLRPTEARLTRLLRVIFCTMAMFLTPFTVSSGGQEEGSATDMGPESTCQWDLLVPKRFPNSTEPSPIPDTWSDDSDIRWLSDADQIGYENDQPIYEVRRMIWNVGNEDQNVTWKAGRMQVTPLYANEYAVVYEEGVLHVNKLRGKLYPWSNQHGIDTDAYLSYRLTHNQLIQSVRSTVCIVLGHASPEQPGYSADYRSEIIVVVSRNGTGITLTYSVLNYTNNHVEVTISPGMHTVMHPDFSEVFECQCGKSVVLSDMKYWSDSLEVDDLPNAMYFGITLDWGERSVTAIVSNYGL